MSPAWKRALLVAGSTAVVVAVVAIVFLLRAGDAGAANWPVNWELRSSDNGTLFEVMRDAVEGRTLDWSFSPQVFVFPELPISALAYAITGGSIYGYYLAVAAINSALLFLALVLLARSIWRDAGLNAWLIRAGVAMLPLVLLPLIGTSWLVSFHLAPTYYFGMYLALIGSPALFFAERRLPRVLIGAALALTVASNPLTLVFAGPAFAVVLIVALAGRGWRGIRRPLLTFVALVLVAVAVRLAVFTPLQGTSPLTYIDPEVFAGRLAGFRMYFAYLATDSSTFVILVIGGACALGGVVAAVVASVRFLRGSGSPRLLIAVYLGLVPVPGIAGTYLLMITHYLYTWPLFIAPMVFALLLVPTSWGQRVLALSPALFLVIALATGSVSSVGHPERYFGYRNPETMCIDESVPPGTTAGYATFSDSRRLSLTSARGIDLVPLETDATPSMWLTNRAYPRELPGSFFYINGAGDELAIDAALVATRFGDTDQRVDCSDSQYLMIYTDPQKRALIAAYYGSH